MKSPKPTIKAIAEAAGVSVGTVDRVIHNRGEVAAETKSEILRLMNEFNYKSTIVKKLSHARSIVVLIPKVDSENTFWACHKEGIEQQAALANDASVVVSIICFDIHSENDFTRQAQHVLSLKPDGVIMAPLFATEAKLFTAQLDALNIPYIYIDTMIDDTNPISFIGEDAFQSGRVAASIIDFGIDKNKNILMVNIAKNTGNTQHLNARNQGFMSYFMDRGQNSGLKISVEIQQTDPESIECKLDEILQNNDIGAIWVSGSRAYLIAQYLEKRGIRDIILVGYDIYDRNIEYLKRNIIHFLIAQQPREQGRKALRILTECLNGSKRPLLTEYQKVEIVNSESLRFFFNN